MYNFFSKNGLMAALIVGIVISAITMIMLLSSDETELVETIRYSSASNFGLFGVYFLGIGSALLALMLPLLSMLNEPKKLIAPLAGVGALVVIYFISYAFADSYAPPKLVEDFQLTEGESKMVGGAIITMYILVIGAVVSAVYSEISNAFK